MKSAGSGVDSVKTGLRAEARRIPALGRSVLRRKEPQSTEWRGSREEEGKAGFWSILDVQTQVFQERRVVLNANGKSSRKKLKKYPLNFIAFMSMWNKGSGPLMRDCVCESWYQGVGRMGVVIRVLQRNRTKNIYVITKEREAERRIKSGG